VPLTFEWDSRKASANLSKHGVKFETAATVFGEPSSLTIPDPDHSAIEPRHITIGRAFNGKLFVVVHTDGGDNIRIISARGASRRERKLFEEEIE
jgi:uncharacterized protein